MLVQRVRRRIRKSRRKLSDNDPTPCPATGSEELECWDLDIEDWMTSAPGGK